MAQGRGHHGQGKSVNPGVDRATDARGTARRLRTKGLRLLEVVRPHGGWDSPDVYCPLGQDPSAAEGGSRLHLCGAHEGQDCPGSNSRA